jgi:hypothetical protein
MEAVSCARSNRLDQHGNEVRRGGVIIAPMAKDLGLSQGTLGFGSTVFLLCFGLMAPLLARAIASAQGGAWVGSVFSRPRRWRL